MTILRVMLHIYLNVHFMKITTFNINAKLEN